MTTWARLPPIIRPQSFQRSALGHLIGSPAAGQCGLGRGAPAVRQLEVMARNVAAGVFRENFDEVASSHHRTRNEVLRFEGSRRRKIERTMSLWIEFG